MLLDEDTIFCPSLLHNTQKEQTEKPEGEVFYERLTQIYPDTIFFKTTLYNL